MAKIRSIKPEFWESEQVGECSPMARLLFICLLNFCDDGGNYPASVKAMKRNAFGYDEVSASQVQKMMDELIAQKLVVTYEADGKVYWHVTGFAKHQTIARPFYKYPPFPDVSSPENDEFLPEQCSSNVQALPEQCSSNVQALRERETVREKERERKGNTLASIEDVSTPTGPVPETPVARAGLFARLLTDKGVRANPGNPVIRKLAANGVPVETVQAAVDLAVSKGKRSVGYVVGIIESWQKESDGMKADGRAKPPKAKNDWQGFLAAEMRTIEGDVHVVEG